VRSPWPGEPDRPDQAPPPGAPPVDAFPRRLTDRIERATSRLLGLGVLVVVVLAVLVSLNLHRTGMEQASRDLTDRDQVLATLAVGVAMPVGLDVAAAAGAGTAPATWVTSDGTRHTGVVPVLGARAAGDTVPVWVDRSGALAAPPVNALQANVTAVVGGLLVALGGALLLFGIRAAVRAHCAVVNHRAWARDWAFHEPLWSGR